MGLELSNKVGEEVKFIHNSSDNKTSNIALALKEKLSNGGYMPDYEMFQKRYSHFGDVIYCNGTSGIHRFETTCSITNISDDGTWGYFTINIDRKVVNNIPQGGGDCIGFSIRFIALKFGNEDDLIFNETNPNEWTPVSKESKNTQYITYYFDSISYTINFRIKLSYINSYYGVDFNTFLTSKLRYKSYVRCSNFAIGFICSQNKQWYFVPANTDDVKVKHGFTEYKKQEKTVWGVGKWIRGNYRKKHTHPHHYKYNTGILYRGYCKFRNGGSNQQDYYYKNIRTIGWHKWSGQCKSIYGIINLARKKNTIWEPYVYILKPEKNMAALYKTYSDDYGSIQSPMGDRNVFIKYISAAEYYNILMRKPLLDI